MGELMNADRDVRVNYDITSYEVQTCYFLHTAVKSIGQPYHTRIFLKLLFCHSRYDFSILNY